LGDEEQVEWLREGMQKIAEEDDGTLLEDEDDVALFKEIDST
jgi:hypothetical protein